MTSQHLHSQRQHNNQGPIVVALGGHALGDDSGSIDNESLAVACAALTPFTDDGLVLTHGNGPQLGYLLHQQQKGLAVTLDVANALSEGWIGYALEQELARQVDAGADNSPVTTILTRVEVETSDPEFKHPSKPIGAHLTADEVDQLKSSSLGHKKSDGYFQLLAPSPKPVRCLQSDAIRALLTLGKTVICAGGGGVPVARQSETGFHGVNAVIDKDRTSALIATELNARLLVLATDVKGIYKDWPADPEQRPLELLESARIQDLVLDTGSMGAKAEAARDFVTATGQSAVIGCIDDLEGLLKRRAGTRVLPDSAPQ